MSLTVKDLKKMLEQMNIPDDAEIWLEFPVSSGVACHGEKSTHEVRTNEYEQREDWINASTLGWSPGLNKIRIFHHPLTDK